MTLGTQVKSRMRPVPSGIWNMAGMPHRDMGAAKTGKAEGAQSNRSSQGLTTHLEETVISASSRGAQLSEAAGRAYDRTLLETHIGTAAKARLPFLSLDEPRQEGRGSDIGGLTRSG